MKLSLRILIWILCSIFAVLLVSTLILFILLLIWSPGKVKPFKDSKGKIIKDSISEKIFVDINGDKQGMFIRGKDKNNPVLLFVHGGPGMPEYFLTEHYNSYLEDHFTVCYWEQRGAGFSYKSDISPESITIDQIVSDTGAVTDYLRKRFGQDKIYLLGRSWGSFIGIQAAEKAPEKYKAYIAVAQVSRQLESEKLAYDYMLKKYKKAGNTKMVKELETYNIHESDTAMFAYLSTELLRDQAMHEIGIGTMHNMKSVITGIILPSCKARAYTISEKINIWRGKTFLKKSTNLQRDMYATDLTLKIPKLNVPVYFFSGKYDYTVSCKLAEQYYRKLQAPMKGFYTFDKSAHSPHFEEPEKFINIMMEDVLKGKTGLADKN